MWFDIIRKKVVNMEVVRDMMAHLRDIIDKSPTIRKLNLPRNKFNSARSTFRWIQKNMYVIEYDEWYEERAPRVRESEAYAKRFEKVLKELTEWYNSIPQEKRENIENFLTKSTKI